jgi:hypothetical protein
MRLKGGGEDERAGQQTLFSPEDEPPALSHLKLIVGVQVESMRQDVHPEAWCGQAVCVCRHPEQEERVPEDLALRSRARNVNRGRG